MDPYLITYVVASGGGGERGAGRLPANVVDVLLVVNVSADDEKAGGVEEK